MGMRDQSGFDVVVVGAGLAGIAAALEASKAGARVLLASLGPTLSGSSFFGGTWGLGLVGPLDENDLPDFERTICEVGCGQADPELVHTLVSGIEDALHWLEGMDVQLKLPIDASQQAYIPCFDHRTRSWHGIVRESLRERIPQALDRLGVTRLPHTELLDFEEHERHVSAALLFDHRRSTVLRVPCGALVLATGGLAGLYERNLTAADTCGSVHGIALSHGCSLVNAEFLQMMPGIVSPVQGVVVNEKAFRYATLPLAQELLEERSGYGPFTSRLPSHAVDLAICDAGTEGLPLSYRLPARPPELVADYFTWLSSTFGIAPQDEIRVALYAHASNGGISITPTAACTGGPAGLFACGECAGGMHGADRIGGLASAAALVFGRIAGRSAAAEAERGYPAPAPVKLDCLASPEQAAIFSSLRQTMQAHAMVGRTEHGLAGALDTIAELERRLSATTLAGASAKDAVKTHRTSWQLAVAQAMLLAMRTRRESCGSHHRADAQVVRDKATHCEERARLEKAIQTG